MKICKALTGLQPLLRHPASIRLVLLSSCGLFLASCASTVKVKTDTAGLTRESIRSANLLENLGGSVSSVATSFGSVSQGLLKEAHSFEKKGKHVDSAANFLKVAADAFSLLESGVERRGSESERTLINIHNAALARFTELWAKDPRRLKPGPYYLSSEGENFEIDLSRRSDYAKHYFDHFVPAKAIEEEGMVRNVRDGLGAPGVGIREHRPERAEEMKFYPARGLYTPVTVTMDSVTKPRKSDGMTKVFFSMRNPMLQEDLALSGRSLPLAADFSAPIALIMKGRNETAFGLDGFLSASDRLKISGIFLMEPYDPDRIPVLLVHGLVSSPYIWREILSEMMSDPDISKRYQFMLFGYPSSLPLVESAKLLRDRLSDLRMTHDPDGNDALSRNMVVVGHSMGGMLTHTLAAEFGDNLWKQFSDLPFDEVSLDAEKKEELREFLFFEPDPAIRCAVYYSAPHRGAKMAEKNLVGMVSKLAKLPVDAIGTTMDFVDPASDDQFKIPLHKKYTSRESLEPGAPMVTAMDISPYKKGVVYHSVMGDEGKGDTPDSSDGIVDYWSSYQEGAASELIVPTGHTSYQHPLAVERLRDILREHAGLRATRR